MFIVLLCYVTGVYKSEGLAVVPKVWFSTSSRISIAWELLECRFVSPTLDLCIRDSGTGRQAELLDPQRLQMHTEV